MTGRYHLGRLAQYALVGGVGTGAHYFTMIALVEGAGFDPLKGSIAGSFVGAIVNYLLNRRFVFTTQRAHHEALPRFLLIAGIAVALNALLMQGWLAYTTLPYLLAQLLTTALLLVFTYAGNAIWTFRH
ncbi:hypothetical protein BH09PSE6_BH09PSE6_28250 [soil metagenome]